MVSDHESKDIDTYLSKLPEDRRQALEYLRHMIHRAAPQVSESMSYGMPVFEFPGGGFALAAQKHYLSLYMDVTVVEKHRAELGALDIGKSCIRYKKLESLPLDVIEKMMVEAANL